jgi:arginine exporter protein ArgO
MDGWSGFGTVAAAGAAAGLGVAVPLGAVGVLVVQEAMRDRRAGRAAGAAVAVVDMAYAGVAVALGPLVAAALSGVEAWVRLVSALVLGGIAAYGLVVSPARAAGAGTGTGNDAGAGAGRRGDPEGEAGATGSGGLRGEVGAGVEGGAGPRAAGGAAGVDGGPPARGRIFVRFTALTLINPTTALYFAALTTAGGTALSGGAAGTVFAAGVFAASLAWQQLLVAVSGWAGTRLSDRTRRWTFRAGYGLVALYAVGVALPLPAL